MARAAKLTDLFDKVISRSEYTADEIQIEVAAGRMQVWPGRASIAITQLLDRPGEKVCHVLLIAGDGAELETMETSVATWAKAQGCAKMTQCGRLGWSRVLKRRGWRAISVKMERSI